MCYTAVLGRLITLEHSVVSQHRSDPKPIVSEDILPALRLNEAMDLIVAPGLDGRFVPPERERNQLRRVTHTSEALDGDKPVQGVEMRAQSPPCRCIFARSSARIQRLPLSSPRPSASESDSSSPDLRFFLSVSLSRALWFGSDVSRPFGSPRPDRRVPASGLYLDHTRPIRFPSD